MAQEGEGEREGGAVQRVVDTRYEKRIEWERERAGLGPCNLPLSLSVSSSEPAHEMPNQRTVPTV